MTDYNPLGIQHVTAKLINGDDFSAVGELIRDDDQAVVFDLDGGVTYLPWRNVLYLVAVPSPESLVHLG
ncbi:hypothetical protein ACFC1L_39735 [Streptomyces sp. NPDC056210]|uniref:hypothetical protein n=1 Tax=Streptomyces sp. NPDC056210 TaxID=3345746 RepID=UPI0035DBCA64